MSHSNPYTGESFGDTVAFRRGTTIVADGGTADAEDADAAEDGDDDQDANATRPRMKDVDKTPPHGAPDPNVVHMRGGEGAADDEVAEE